jgi:hypothetical protein
VRRSEWIAAVYFAYLLIPIAALDFRRSHRLASAALAATGASAVVAFSALPSGWVCQLARDWVPGIYLLAGYWLPGRLYTAPNQRVEQRLAGFDQQLADLPFVQWLGRRTPAVVREYLELTYLFCYPLVPLSFGIVYVATRARPEDTDFFWSVVLLASYLCYGLLPWIPTRPPRSSRSSRPGGSSKAPGLRSVNLFVLDYGSIQVNTFPSAHVAGSIASALVTGAVMPIAGFAVGIVAASIAVASVVGRYHYAADALLGAAVAFVVFYAMT